ncbi:MAG: PAS domain-containing protein [Gemmatimonadetes bacterium]|nr:PAS domain-containing protein [Gemmatimonadota bacterium]
MAGSRGSDEHYRLLFEGNPQPMWVYDAESLQFLTVNEAAIARYGYSRDEFLGMRITDIRPREDVRALLKHLSAHDERIQTSGAWRQCRKDGSVILVDISSHEIRFEGRRARLVLAVDVTERERALEELRRSREEYERQYDALATLTSRRILQSQDQSSALREITQHTARTLDVERVSIWQLTEERDAIVAQDLFERSAARHSSGAMLAAATYPSYFRALAGSEVLVADDAERDARTSEFTEGYLRPNGITSMLDAPVLVDGELAGVLCLEHVGPRRTWTAGERSFAVSVANLVALIRAQGSLSRSRVWLQTILDSEPECVALVGPDARLMEMNPAGLRMIEAADLSLVVGSEVVQLIHPSDRSSYLDLHRSVLNGASGRLQYRVVGLAGTERWMETHAAPLRADGNVVAMLSVTQDISDRIRTETDLHESRRRLTTLMDHLPGMAYRGHPDPDRIMEFVSNGAVELTGLEPEAMYTSGGRPYGGLVHAADRERVWEQTQAAIHSHQPFEFEYRIAAADGTTKWVWERGHAVYRADGTVIAVEGFIADTTQRRHSADALRTSEERFRLLAQATSDVIWDWDITRGTLWWGEGAQQLLGTSHDQLGDDLADWTSRLHPEDRDRVMDSLEAAIESDVETWTSEYRFRRGDDTYATVLDRGHVIRDETGRAIRMIGGISDLTERRRLETQLLHSQKMESVGRLAGGVAHDFNNLLTVILGTVDLALTGRNTDARLAADLGEIRGAAERAAGLTQQLLAFSRRQVLQPRVLDINATIDGTFALLRRLIGEDVSIRFTPEPDLWNVRADPGQLEQVLLNLAINARDAMPTGGQLTISTRNRMIDEAYLTEHADARPGPHVVITVSDSGVGMDADTRAHAFDPFFTTKPVGKGTGLGLATVYGIVQQSGGAIHLYSEPGRGTTFRILLPRAEGAVAATHAKVPVRTEGGSETILLVEDEAPVRRLVQRILTDAGYTVLAVGSAEEAMTLVNELSESVHLLLTDVVMPLMNGPDLANRILELSPETRVLFMSGYTNDALAHHVARPGHTDLLEKPFTIAELTHAVRAAMS